MEKQQSLSGVHCAAEKLASLLIEKDCLGGIPYLVEDPVLLAFLHSSFGGDEPHVKLARSSGSGEEGNEDGELHFGDGDSDIAKLATRNEKKKRVWMIV